VTAQPPPAAHGQYGLRSTGAVDPLFSGPNQVRMTVAVTDLENRVNKNTRLPFGSLSGDDFESRLVPPRAMFLNNTGYP